MFRPVKNPTDSEIAALIRGSKHSAARRIFDARTGDYWYWPAEQATHREGADLLTVPYERPPGTGDIVTL